MQLQSLEDVFAEQIADLLSAEQQLVEALPKVAKAASSRELRSAFDDHLEQTRGHVERLEQLKRGLDVDIPEEHCEGIEGLIKEGESIVEASGEADAKDAALIAAAQRVEHYEISGYGTARTLAEQLGYEEVAGELGEILAEESEADEKLTSIATSRVNRQAAT